ncbi:MAG TPA: spermidine/putrescine ABC transporter substrate-binding protein [Ardenticatenaceae bacterium]
MRDRYSIVLLALLALLLAACANPVRSTGEAAAPTNGEVAANGAAAQGLFTGNCTPEGTLRLWNRPGAMDPEIMAQFATLYGVDVKEEQVADEEEMIRGVRAGNSGYDLVFPSDVVVAHMIEGGLLRELDRANIPNGANLNPGLMDLPYDPGNRYTLPYLWSVTGIAYNATYFNEPPGSWAHLLDPDLALQVGLFSMLDDGPATLVAALQYLGYSANDGNPEHLAEARDLLLGLQGYPNFMGYDSVAWAQALEEEQLQLAHAESSEAARAASRNEAIRFVVPEEGGIIRQTNVAIPADAPNPCSAELFINYLLQPEIAAQLVRYTYANSPVPAAPLLLDPLTQELMARGFLPDAQTMERLEWLGGQQTARFEEMWTEVRGEPPMIEP